MATLQSVGNQQINEVLGAACQRRLPATLTVRTDCGWANYRSRLLATQGGHVWLEMPSAQPDQPPREFQPADKVGVSFKLKHHKHIFTGTVARTDWEVLDDGSRAQVLRVCSPTKMHRMQRRAFFRADVPPNRVVRVSFWMGGRDAEPAGTTPGRPVWSGRVANLSAGGFQVVTEDDVVGCLDVGETVGVRIIFGAGEETAYADAQFRHTDDVNGDLYLGFQFVGLAQTTEGRSTLQLIGNKASMYQRERPTVQRVRT